MPQRPAAERAELVVELADQLDAMVAYWDADQTCVYANAAYQAWFGRDGQRLIGTTLQQLLGPLYELNLPHIRAAYAGQKQVFERAIPTPDGSGVRHSLATYIPRIVDGRVDGMFVHVADVGPLKQLEAELRAAKAAAERMATHDFLTGLPNRAMLENHVVQAMAQAKRRDEVLALMYVDVDNFKSVNDTFGHAEGDHYLVDMARRLSCSVRAGDTVLRLGGDEFAVVAGDVRSAAEALELASRIVEQAREPYLIGGKSIVPTVSIGVALYPRHGASIAVLAEAADRALYAAKHAGRDTFALAD